MRLPNVCNAFEKITESDARVLLGWIKISLHSIVCLFNVLFSIWFIILLSGSSFSSEAFFANSRRNNCLFTQATLENKPNFTIESRALTNSKKRKAATNRLIKKPFYILIDLCDYANDMKHKWGARETAPSVEFGLTSAGHLPVYLL